ncbi:MAG: hypothetical protein JNL18_02875 [Planctomycetaceae bacterium]|nr:hypothetical protein [Planctomycetaceae bacterium]
MRVVGFLPVCFVTLAWTLPVAALTSNWNNNTGGSFPNAANWTAGVPLVNDTAVFDRNLAIEYSVTFPGRPILNPLTRDVRQLIVGANTVSFSDSVNFNQLPANFAIDAAKTLAEGALIVGNVANQAGGLNTTLSNFSTSSVIVGHDGSAPSTEGTLNVNGGTFHVTGSQELGDELIIGNDARGFLNIAGGADVNVTGGPHANAVFGRSGIFGTDAYGTVSGVGSTLNISGGLVIADESPFARLTIQAGGQLTSGSAVLGKSSFLAFGQVLIEDAGSTWTNNGDAIIGKSGGGQLIVSDGGQVLTSGSASIGELIGSGGFADITDPGSMWSIGGDLVLGRTGTGSSSELRVFGDAAVAVGGLLTVASTGRVIGNGSILGNIANGGVVEAGVFSNLQGPLEVDGSYTQLAAGKLAIDLAGAIPATTYDQLLVSGSVSLNGTLEVLLIGPFVPALGNAFNIINGASITGKFTSFLLPTLPSGRSWNISQLYTTGTLLVTLPGDFDADGDVDGNDFLVWQRGDTPNPHSPADLAAWKSNFGFGAAMAAGAAVPEPGPLLWAIMAAGAGLLGRGTAGLGR